MPFLTLECCQQDSKGNASVPELHTRLDNEGQFAAKFLRAHTEDYAFR